MRELREDRLRLLRRQTVDTDERDDAGEHRDQQADHPAERCARVAPRRRLERRYGIGNRFDPRHRGGAGGEGAQHQHEAERLGAMDHTCGRRVEVVLRRVDEPDTDDQEDREHEQVGRCGKHRAGLAETAHVDGEDRCEHDDSQHDRVRSDARDRRGDGRNTGRDRHRDREHVVDDQPGRGEQSRQLAEVLACDRVGAASVRVGADRLAVGQPDGEHQHADRERDWDRVRERAGSGDDEHGQHCLGSIGDR